MKRGTIAFARIERGGQETTALPYAVTSTASAELSTLLDGLRLARGFLSTPGPRARATLRGRWYPHTPALAAALAEMLERCPEPFARLPLAAAALRAEQGRIDELETARAGAAELIADLDAELVLRKSRLSDWVALLLRSARAQLADPLAATDELRTAAGKALALIERWSQGRTRARRRTLRERGSGTDGLQGFKKDTGAAREAAASGRRDLEP